MRFGFMLALVVSALALARHAAACVCVDLEPIEVVLKREFEAKRWVIVGEVGQPQRVSSSPDRWTATLTVTEALKGDIAKGQTLPIEIVDDPSSCGGFIWRGERLLLFLDRLQVGANDYGGCLPSGPQGDNEDSIEIARRLAGMH